MKILLTTFGGYAQTAIFNPVVFNPPLGRLDHLSVQLTDVNGTIINNSDCEWTAVLNITELQETATIDSTLPKINFVAGGGSLPAQISESNPSIIQKMPGISSMFSLAGSSNMTQNTLSN